WRTPALFLLLVPCSFAFLGSFFSIGYQWRVVGSWCKMCLLVVAVIWLQEGLLLLYLKQNSASLSGILSANMARVILLFLFSFFIAGLWFMVKPQIVLALETASSRKQLSVWKRNSSLF